MGIKQVVKYKIDCLYDYNILMKQNKQVICVGQSNIFNINEFKPCQIVHMRIQYKSFEGLFETQNIEPQFNFNISNKNELTISYIEKLKDYAHKIIMHILSKLNHNNKYETLKPLLRKIKNDFPYDEVIYTEEPKPEIEIDSYDEKCYWVDTIKILLNTCENTRGKFNKMLIIKQIYNYCHKYIHWTIKYNQYRITTLKKIEEVEFEIKIMIQDYLKELKSDPDHTAETYYNISQCISTLNSCYRFKLIVDTGNYDLSPPLVYTINRDCDKQEIICDI
jgi:hypothetical protein